MKELADYLGVDPPTISRMAKGGSVHINHIFRASAYLKIRLPRTFPFNPFQGRILRALSVAEDILAVDKVNALVSEFEEKVKTIEDAMAKLSDGAEPLASEKT